MNDYSNYRYNNCHKCGVKYDCLRTRNDVINCIEDKESHLVVLKTTEYRLVSKDPFSYRYDRLTKKAVLINKEYTSQGGKLGGKIRRKKRDKV